MKTMIAALMLMSAPAMAQSQDYSYSSQDDYQVDYISWCEDNNVMGQTSQGQVYVRANCSEQGLKCKAIQTYRGFRTTVTATCQPAQ